MPVTIRSYRCFPVPCSVACNEGPFFRLPLNYFLGFWLLITLLVLGSRPVYAGWELTSGDDETGLTVYVDPDTILRKGSLVKMWQLYDYKTIQTVAGTSYLSARVQREYNCAGDLQRTLALTKLSGNMGTGKVILTNSDEQKWEPVDPGSIGKRLWKFACNKP